ncbi:unnamed protein product [Gongylonema pulchrum]|uniref:Uncharacterized protein n=1 Tax=Gongylonema pulchrum TaxID=637853 RepID=A0A3P6QZF4_9BILA|nr:unnamed protein product [Gongylonema pulchrum]
MYSGATSNPQNDSEFGTFRIYKKAQDLCEDRCAARREGAKRSSDKLLAFFVASFLSGCFHHENAPGKS